MRRLSAGFTLCKRLAELMPDDVQKSVAAWYRHWSKEAVSTLRGVTFGSVDDKIQSTKVPGCECEVRSLSMPRSDLRVVDQVVGDVTANQ